ncbi:hypothetical protein AALO_G00262230, partial [Alosa alosa]
LHNFQHFIAADVAIAVQVVHTEGPFELLVQATTGRNAQCNDELSEIYRSVTIGVKGAEDVLCELGGVSVREEVSVDLLELLQG